MITRENLEAEKQKMEQKLKDCMKRIEDLENENVNLTSQLNQQKNRYEEKIKKLQAKVEMLAEENKKQQEQLDELQKKVQKKEKQKLLINLEDKSPKLHTLERQVTYSLIQKELLKCLHYLNEK